MIINLLILASSEIIYFRFLAFLAIPVVFGIYSYFLKQNKKNKIDEDIKQFMSSNSSAALEINDEPIVTIQENTPENQNKLLEEFVYYNSYFSKKYLPQTVAASIIIMLLIFVFLKFQLDEIIGVIIATILSSLFLFYMIYSYFENTLTNLFYLKNDLKIKIYSSKIEVYNLNDRLVFEINANQIMEIIFHPEYQENRYGIKSISRHLITLRNSHELNDKKIRVDVVNSEFVQEFFLNDLLTFSERAKGKIQKLKFKEVVFEFARLNNLKITNNY
jgi:hypothetical protein